MKTQADSADLWPPQPHHPQTGSSSLSIKPVFCFLLNFSSSLQSQLDFMEGRGLHSRTSCTRKQKTRKTTTKRKKQRGDTTGIQRSLHCLELHPLAKRGQRGIGEKQQTLAESHYFSLLFGESAMNVRKNVALTLHTSWMHSNHKASLSAGAENSLSPKCFNSARRKRQTI